MRILYWTWSEWAKTDGIMTLQKLGHQVDLINEPVQNLEENSSRATQICASITANQYDYVFSFNYFPMIARICRQCQVKYISWVYDAPHLTLESKTIQYDTNYVFVFDYQLFTSMRQKGRERIFYQPLGVNTLRLDELLQPIEQGTYLYDVSFVGSLYDDTYNFYDQIQFMPEELRGYLDAMMQSQLQVYGYDLTDAVVRGDILERLSAVTEIELGEDYFSCKQDVLKDMIRRKITSIERKKLLTAVGEQFPLTLCAPKKPEHMKMNYLGYVDYVGTMPKIFRQSKINLNITLRSIKSGIPLRALDIMGAGGFLLTNYQPEIAEYFTNGQDLVWYESEADLLEKIAYYLTHEAERTKIAECGQKRVAKQFSYERQMEEMLTQVGMA